MLKKPCVDKVKAELKRVKDAIKELESKADQYTFKRDQYSDGKYTGALKRASMDLTRALADLRRNPYS